MKLVKPSHDPSKPALQLSKRQDLEKHPKMPGVDATRRRQAHAWVIDSASWVFSLFGFAQSSGDRGSNAVKRKIIN